MDLEYIHDERHKRILEFIAPSRDDKILVIGTGNCPRIEFLLFTLYGCESIVSGDIKPAHTEAGRAALPKLKFIHLDAQQPFPLEDGLFDKVVFTEVLEHLKDEDLPLQEIRRVLKPSGILILSVPKRRWFRVLNPVWWLEHEREYTEDSLAEALSRNGFRIERQFVGGSIFDVLRLWVFLIYKYVFRTIRDVRTFRLFYQQSYRPDFMGKGSSIIVKAVIKA